MQFVVSGKFLILLMIAAALVGGGYYWYKRQVRLQRQISETQERFKTPPYFVNLGASVIRTCQQCLVAGKLRPQPEWKVGTPKEIPAEEQRWFLAVEDPPAPVTVSGVLMLPVFPSVHDNPALGFNQSRVMLVLYQNLQRKTTIEQPPPATASPDPATASETKQ